MVDYQTQLYLQQQLRTKADTSRVVKIERQIADLNVPDMSQYVQRPELVPYALKSEIPNLTTYVQRPELVPYALKTELPNLEPYALKTELPNLQPYVQRPELVPYALKTEIPSLTNYYTKSESDLKYCTLEQLANTNQSVADLQGENVNQEMTIMQIENQIQNFVTQPQTDALYISKTIETSLQDKYTKAESDSKYALKTDIPEDVDMSNYYTKTQTDAQFLPRSEAPDLTQYATLYYTDQSVIGAIQQATQMVDNHNQDNINQFQLVNSSINQLQGLIQTNAIQISEMNQTNQAQNTRMTDIETRQDVQGNTLANHLNRIIVLEQAGTFDPTSLLQRVSTLETQLAQLGTMLQESYYSKTQSEQLFALKSEMPNMSNYYNKTESDAKFSTTEQHNNQQFSINSLYQMHDQQEAFFLLLEEQVDQCITYTEADAKYAQILNTYNKTEADARYAQQTNIYNKTEADARYAPISTVAQITDLVGQVGFSNSYWQGAVNVGDIGGQLGTFQVIPSNGSLSVCQKRHLNNNMSQVSISWSDRGFDIIPQIFVMNGDGGDTDSWVNDMSPLVLRPQGLFRASCIFILEVTSARVEQCQLYVILHPKYSPNY